MRVAGGSSPLLVEHLMAGFGCFWSVVVVLDAPETSICHLFLDEAEPLGDRLAPLRMRCDSDQVSLQIFPCFTVFGSLGPSLENRFTVGFDSLIIPPRKGSKDMTHLAQVVGRLEIERKRIQSELERITTALSALNGLGTKDFTRSKRGPVTAAARARIATAQRVRWAKWRKENKKLRS